MGVSGERVECICLGVSAYEKGKKEGEEEKAKKEVRTSQWK